MLLVFEKCKAELNSITPNQGDAIFCLFLFFIIILKMGALISN
jgi:hypothetical protein